MGLGFAVGRRGSGSSGAGERRQPHSAEWRATTPDDLTARRRELAQTLRSFRGQWVAVADDELLVAAATPHEVVGWLAQHGRRAESSMFRVPEDELALGGLAPL